MNYCPFLHVLLMGIIFALVAGPAAALPAQVTPEEVITDLEVAWRTRDVEAYAGLLGHDFIFQFQPDDASDLGVDTWTRDQDSTGVSALFEAQEVTDIRILFAHGPAELSSDPEYPDAMRIRVSPTFLEIDVASGTTYSVSGDIQDIFLEEGDPLFDEDPERWYITGWRDIPGGAEPGMPEGVSFTVGQAKTLFLESTPAEIASWGRVRAMYRGR